MAQRDRSESPPPSKASLKAWWKAFTNSQKFKRDAVQSDKEPSTSTSRVFGVPLRESLRYANVQISTATGEQGGDVYIYGYVPVVVAKCGLYLKEHATEVEGVFRVNGSARRMRELQAVFETPPRYGKDLDWRREAYTSHDVASVFRRYLTQMPEPVIPHNLYHRFRDSYSATPFVVEKVVSDFKALIHSMPRSNQYLLLYVLDLLSVFARKSDKNLMTAQNLAVIFRPGTISHPDQELSPEQHKLTQEVLEFLIEQQDHFLLEPPPPSQNDSVLLTASSPTESEEVYIAPSESDEGAPTHGWKVVENGRQGKLPPLKFADTKISASQMYTTPTPSPGGASVKRSLTVPSKPGTRKGRDMDKSMKDSKLSMDRTDSGNGLKRSGSVQDFSPNSVKSPTPIHSPILFR